MPTKWRCLTCEDEPEFELRDDLLQHLNEKHNHHIGASAKRTPTLFLDGANGLHQQVYEWDFGDYKVEEIWRSK